MEDSEIWSMAAAIRNHLAMRPQKEYTALEIAEFAGEWPAVPWPIERVLTALTLLEATKVVVCIKDAAGKRWKQPNAN